MVAHPRPKRGRGRRNPDGAQTSQLDMSQVVDPTPDQYHVTCMPHLMWFLNCGCEQFGLIRIMQAGYCVTDSHIVCDAKFPFALGVQF